MTSRKSRIAQYDGFEYAKGCVGKKSYPSKRHALGTLRTLPDESSHPIMAAYKCKFCGRYHLGKDRYA